MLPFLLFFVIILWGMSWMNWLNWRNWRQVIWRSPMILLVCFIFVTTLMGCAPMPSASSLEANPRTFSALSVEFLDEYHIPKDDFEETEVGGLSAISYDPRHDVYYAQTDDRSLKAPARFYRLKIDLDESGAIPQIDNVRIESATTLIRTEGKPFSKGRIDPEGIAFSPRNTVFISSEGNRTHKQKPLPFVKEFSLDGQELGELRIPDRFLYGSPTEGVQVNAGFEALAIAAPSLAPEDPFRLFVAPEYSLIQDAADNNITKPIRFLHYVINPIGDPVLIAEHLYPLEPTPNGALGNGLVELAALPQEGELLSLERTYGLWGFGVKLFQFSLGNATDTTKIESLAGNPASITPIKKTLLLDLKTLGIGLDNLEGMTLGRKFADGSQSLILISDDNFRDDQVNQVLLFRLSNSAANATSK
jgi:hypothetical protein